MLGEIADSCLDAEAYFIGFSSLNIPLCFSDIAKARFPSSPEEQETVARDFVHNKVPAFCDILEKILQKNGGKFFVEKSVIFIPKLKKNFVLVKVFFSGF